MWASVAVVDATGDECMHVSIVRSDELTTSLKARS